MAAEVEAKFRADGPDPLLALAAESRLGDATLGPPRTVEEVDRYLDTDDGRLSAALWACRLREREGRIRVSLKGPAEMAGVGWLHRRPEVEGPATASVDPADWPPSEATELLATLRGDGALHERFHLRQRRTERAVRVGDDPLGTLSLDRVTVADGRRDHGELFVVELELADDSPLATSLLAALAERLAGRQGLEPDPRSKLEHALELLDGVRE